jgi:hypothetical protein
MEEWYKISCIREWMGFLVRCALEEQATKLGLAVQIRVRKWRDSAIFGAFSGF